MTSALVVPKVTFDTTDTTGTQDAMDAMTPGTVPGLLADILAELRAATLASKPLPILLSATAAAEFVGLSRSGFYREVSAGTIPRPCETESGPRWKRNDLERWAERLKPRHRAKQEAVAAHPTN